MNKENVKCNTTPTKGTYLTDYYSYDSCLLQHRHHVAVFFSCCDAGWMKLTTVLRLQSRRSHTQPLTATPLALISWQMIGLRRLLRIEWSRGNIIRGHWWCSFYIYLLVYSLIPPVSQCITIYSSLSPPPLPWCFLVTHLPFHSPRPRGRSAQVRGAPREAGPWSSAETPENLVVWILGTLGRAGLREKGIKQVVMVRPPFFSFFSDYD